MKTGKFHQYLPLLQLFEGLKMGVSWHKNVKTFDDGISCVKKNYMKVWMPPVLNVYPKVYLGEKINCLLPPIAELLRWEPRIVFQLT